MSFPSFKKYLRDHGGNFVLDLDKEDADEEIWDFFLDIDDLVKNMKQHHPKQQRESVTVLTQTVKFLSELSTHPEGCKMLMSEDYLRCLGSMLFVQNDEIKTAARVACENVVAAIWAEEKVKLWKHSGSAFLAGGRGDMSRRESDWMKGWFAPAPPAVAAVAAVEATAAADLEDLQATREETLRFASMLMMMIQVTDDRMLPSRFYDALLNEIRMGKEVLDIDDLVKNMKQHHPKQQRESVTVLTQTVKFLSELSTHPEGCKMLMSEDYLRCLGSMLFVQNDEIKTAARVACENVVAAIWAEEKVKLWKHSGSAFLAGGRGDMSRRESDWMKGWFAPAPPAVAAVAAVEATAAADLEDLQATREETLRFASMLMMMIQVTDDRMLPSRFYDALLNEIRMGKEVSLLQPATSTTKLN